MLAFLRDANTARSVSEIFEHLYEVLGHETFTNLFPVILTDRGSEFTDPLAIEFNKENQRRTHVFIAIPNVLIKKEVVKLPMNDPAYLATGTSFDALKQKDINLMMSHINSYTRKKLNNQSAYELFSFLHGQEILEKLKIKEIPADKINMTPLLLKK